MCFNVMHVTDASAPFISYILTIREEEHLEVEVKEEAVEEEEDIKEEEVVAVGAVPHQMLAVLEVDEIKVVVKE